MTATYHAGLRHTISMRRDQYMLVHWCRELGCGSTGMCAANYIAVTETWGESDVGGM
jgi:hypothetical protein